MRGLEDEIADGDIRVELLADLPLQGRGVGFVRAGLATGKLPQVSEVHARLTPGQQKPAIVNDHGGDDDEVHALRRRATRGGVHG